MKINALQLAFTLSVDEERHKLFIETIAQLQFSKDKSLIFFAHFGLICYYGILCMNYSLLLISSNMYWFLPAPNWSSVNQLLLMGQNRA